MGCVAVQTCTRKGTVIQMAHMGRTRPGTCVICTTEVIQRTRIGAAFDRLSRIKGANHLEMTSRQPAKIQSHLYPFQGRAASRGEGEASKRALSNQLNPCAGSAHSYGEIDDIRRYPTVLASQHCMHMGGWSSSKVSKGAEEGREGTWVKTPNYVELCKRACIY